MFSPNEHASIEDVPNSQQMLSQWLAETFDAGKAWTKVPEDLKRLSDPPIIEGLLRAKEVACIVATAKSFKTWISMAMAIAVAEGKRFLDRPTERRKVLFIDNETKRNTMQKRINLLARGRPTDLSLLSLRGKPGPTIDELGPLIAGGDFGLVIVDSLYRTGWLSEENNNDSTGRELPALQRIAEDTGAAIVVVDHTAKGGGVDRSVVDAARGASAKGGFFDALMLLRPPKADRVPKEVDGRFIMLETVLRDWSAWDSNPLLRVHWPSATEAEVSVWEEVPKTPRSSNDETVSSWLKANPDGLTVQQVAEATLLGTSTVREALGKVGKKSGRKGHADLWVLDPDKTP
jgi:AAA domain